VLSLDSAKVCWVSPRLGLLFEIGVGCHWDPACEICVVVRVSCETGDAAVGCHWDSACEICNLWESGTEDEIMEMLGEEE
jgi:hypothetical protein